MMFNHTRFGVLVCTLMENNNKNTPTSKLYIVELIRVEEQAEVGRKK